MAGLWAPLGFLNHSRLPQTTGHIVTMGYYGHQQDDQGRLPYAPERPRGGHFNGSQG